MPLIADPIIDLADAKDFLNITSSEQDAKLATTIASASQAIVNRIGAVSGSPIRDEWHDGGSERIVLRNDGPIQSVTTVTESYGTILYTLNQVSLAAATSDAYAYTVDLDNITLVRRASGIATPFAIGIANIHVTYVAGYATVPEDLKQACRLLVKHQWSPQRGPRQSSNQPTASTMAGMLPDEVEEILAGYVGAVPGIA